MPNSFEDDLIDFIGWLANSILWIITPVVVFVGPYALDFGGHVTDFLIYLGIVTPAMIGCCCAKCKPHAPKPVAPKPQVSLLLSLWLIFSTAN